MFKLRVHANLTAYTPQLEFDVSSEMIDDTLAELTRELQDGALKSIWVQDTSGDGSSYIIKRRFP